MRVTALLGLLLAGTVSGASAQFPETVGTRILDRICGTGGSNVTFTTCYSAEIVSKYNANGVPWLVLKIRNLAAVIPGTTPGAIITGIALDNLPVSVTFAQMSGPYRGTLPATWTQSIDKTFKGAPDPNRQWDRAVRWGGTGTGNSITNTCDPNEPANAWTTAECGDEASLANTGNPWVRFFFSLSTPLEQFELDQLAMNVQFRYVDENNVVTGFHCIEGETCAAIVPEPVTIVLLGTGLAAMGLLRRRRRNGDIADG
jgi:hypothetical protein